MGFPASPVLDQVYTTPSGVAYIYTSKGLWKIHSGATGQGIKFTASPDAPTNQALGDQWFDTINHTLKSWAWDGTDYFWEDIGNQPFVGGGEPTGPVEGQMWWNSITLELSVFVDGEWKVIFSEYLNSAGIIVSRTLPISWQYTDQGFAFEFFVQSPFFRWRSIDPKVINLITSGDDNITVDNTTGIRIGGTYVVSDNNGVFVKEVTVLSVLSDTLVRITEPLDFNMGVAGGKFSNTSFDVQNGYAIVSNGDRLYSKSLNTLRQWPSGQVYIRRSANGQGLFSVFWRITGLTTWTESKMERVVPVDGDTSLRDELYQIPVQDAYVEFKIIYTSDTGITDRVEHIALITTPMSTTTIRVDKPVNVSPADNAVNITATPTLQGSTYRSLYMIEQGGAEFEIAEDDRFQNIVYNTSSDSLAAWLAIAGQSAEFKDACFIDETNGIIVGTSGVIKLTDDGGLTFTDGTPAESAGFNAVAYDATTNKAVVVGDGGKIQYSSNKGSTWTSATPPGSYSGNYQGVAIQGAVVLAVGANGQISRSTNSGVIWSTISPANSYTGTFNCVCMDAAGNCIAVGSNGEVQTSSDYGQNWTKRSTAGNSTAALYGVAMSANIALIVGAAGLIHRSTDRGASWAVVTGDSISTDIFDVDMQGDYAVLVGASGKIQSSYNSGALWTARPAAGAETDSFRSVALVVTDLTVYAMAYGDAGTVQHTLLLNNATTSMTVPSGTDVLSINKIYYWRCRYRDAVGFWSPWSDGTVFATKANFNSIKQPANLAPADGASNVPLTPLLQSSPFAYLGAADTHSKSQWQISPTIDFATLTYDSGEVNDLLAHTIPIGNALNNQSSYYWRVRHKGTTDGLGPFSSPTRFTAVAVPNTPTITSPADNATGVGLAPTLASSAFAISGNTTTHLASQWQIATDTDFAHIINDSGQTSNLRSYTVPSGLFSANTEYFARVRYKGVTTDWSSYSPVVSFTTATVTIAKPVLSTSGITTSQANLSTSAFAVVGAGASDTHAATDWEVRTGADGTGTVVFSSAANPTNRLAITATGLNSAATLHARARHRGTIYGYGPWSDDVVIQTSAASGQALYTAPGTYQFTVPAGVTAISAVCVGGGGNGYDPGLTGSIIVTPGGGGSPNSSGGGGGTTTVHYADSGSGGGGGALCFANNIAVTPGQQLLVVVGDAGQFSSFSNVLSAGGGATGVGSGTAAGGIPSGGTGFAGGAAIEGDNGRDGGGGGAAGYAGVGGRGGANAQTNVVPNSGAGGGGEQGLQSPRSVHSGGGGGVGLNGLGATGAGGYNLSNTGTQMNGKGGSGGENGVATGQSDTASPNGGRFGGGGGAGNGFNVAGKGGSGGVRLIWGPSRSYPSQAA